MPLFSKKVMHFRFFTNEMQSEGGKTHFTNKVIVLNATSALIFQHKNASRRSLKKYYKIGIF